jgi:hypothetical protein
MRFTSAVASCEAGPGSWIGWGQEVEEVEVEEVGASKSGRDWEEAVAGGEALQLLGVGTALG